MKLKFEYHIFPSGRVNQCYFTSCLGELIYLLQSWDVYSLVYYLHCWMMHGVFFRFFSWVMITAGAQLLRAGWSYSRIWLST